MEKQGVVRPGLTKPEGVKCNCCKRRRLATEKQAADEIEQLDACPKKRLADGVAEAVSEP